MNALYLAAAYLRFHPLQTAVLVAVTSLILFVPVATRTLLVTAEANLTSRAEATPLLLGSRGSATDLVMAALYFDATRPEPTDMGLADAVWDSGLAVAIPLHTSFQAQGAPVVGTSVEYLEFRGLQPAQGRAFAVIGEALLGAAAADRLTLGPGDTIVSSPENLFDLDGAYPLEMQVVGTLEPTGTPDDDAVFVDVRTAWVIAGIGHGHDDLVAGDAGAAARAVEFTRITPENIASFHFHGDPGDYPLTAVLAVAPDIRAQTILRGRFLEGPVQAVVPADVIGRLVDRIFRIRAVLDAVAGLAGAAALAAVGLALYLAWRLRAAEAATAFRLGAGRGAVLALLGAETAIVLGLAGLTSTLLAVAVRGESDRLAAWLLLGS